MFGSGMLVAGAIGWALHAPQPAPASLAALMELSTTGLRAANGLDRALETLPSRKLEFTAATAANPVVANPIMAPELTFMHVDGRLCRQFAIQQAAAQRFAGVACRTATKQWRIEIFAQADEPAAARGAIAPAGKPSAVIDGAIDRMIDGDPLDAAGEAKLITNDWRTDSK